MRFARLLLWFSLTVLRGSACAQNCSQVKEHASLTWASRWRSSWLVISGPSSLSFKVASLPKRLVIRYCTGFLASSPIPSAPGDGIIGEQESSPQIAARDTYPEPLLDQIVWDYRSSWALKTPRALEEEEEKEGVVLEEVQLQCNSCCGEILCDLRAPRNLGFCMYSARGIKEEGDELNCCWGEETGGRSWYKREGFQD